MGPSPRTCDAPPGSDHKSAESQFVEDLQAHGGTPGQITEVCQDLSEAFLSGALEHLPEAEITFDRYHVKAQLTKAVDQVRRTERAEHGELLKRSRYLWLRTPPASPTASATASTNCCATR